MTSYSRPALDLPAFRDDRGAVIPYGRRWETEEAPESTYSVAAHPERFAPLVDVATALLAHLEATYDVTRHVDGLTHRLVPVATDAAPLSMTFHDHTVTCTAGISTDIAWICTCDHCDEDVLIAADTLEEEIDAVVHGRFREWLGPYDGEGLFEHHELLLCDGRSSHGGARAVTDEPAGRAAVGARYADVPERWSPWASRVPL
jgi:hypothetical protein